MIESPVIPQSLIATNPSLDPTLSFDQHIKETAAFLFFVSPVKRSYHPCFSSPWPMQRSFHACMHAFPPDTNVMIAVRPAPCTLQMSLNSAAGVLTRTAKFDHTPILASSRLLSVHLRLEALMSFKKSKRASLSDP